MSQPDELVVLGIDTSCDETAIGIVKGDRILSNVVFSQVKKHARYGGVVPEIASRQHLRMILMVYREALKEANVKQEDIDVVAVTYGPGLMGALLVGVNFAKSLACGLGKPFVGVNHLEGHIYANFLAFPELSPPFIVLLVSGGHTELLEFRGRKDVIILGRTRDDAAGEAFDKVARLLGLGYPGGPIIEKVASRGKPVYHFPRGLMDSDDFDFSFSGLKTSVLYFLKKNPDAAVEDVAASFQEAVVDSLIAKVKKAVLKRHIRKIVLAGGVAANSLLREKMHRLGEELKLEVYYPPLELCTDNGAMIARAGREIFLSEGPSSHELTAVPYLTF